MYTLLTSNTISERK